MHKYSCFCPHSTMPQMMWRRCEAPWKVQIQRTLSERLAAGTLQQYNALLLCQYYTPLAYQICCFTLKYGLTVVSPQFHYQLSSKLLINQRTVRWKSFVSCIWAFHPGRDVTGRWIWSHVKWSHIYQVFVFRWPITSLKKGTAGFK